ncbi:MAG: LysR family transcriptional regulator [Pseudomonadota bacterium]
MDKLFAMRVFVTVEAHNSFVLAAEALTISAPAATRAVSWLEQSLNTKLFHRTTRRIRLTEAGGQYLTHAKRILEDIDHIEAQVAGIQIKPSGVLNVTAPILFGERYVTPIIASFLQDFPDVSVNGFMYDNIVDLIEHNIDVAIRIGKPKDSSLFATTVGFVGRVTCASPHYLQENSPIITPEDLKQHTIVYPTRFNEPAVWTYHKNEKPITVKLKPRYQCNQNRSAINAVKRGFGVTRCMSYQVAEELASGELVKVLDTYEDTVLPIQAVSLEGRHNQEKVKLFITYIKNALAENTYLNAKN